MSTKIILLGIWTSICIVFIKDTASWSSSIGWHSDKDVFEAVRDFHDSCARVPDMKPERKIHTELLAEIEEELRKDCFGEDAPMIRFEYTGSTYDGVKIGTDGLEFDIMIIVKGGKTLTAIEQVSGFYQLRPKNPNIKPKHPLSMIMGSNGLVSSEVAKDKFKGRLQRIINKMHNSKYRIKLVEHGPATQMDIYDSWNNVKLYSVDMVPAFEVDGIEYVAKPFRDAGAQKPDIWRISYSLREKARFDALDRGNIIRKQTLRVCKALVVDQSELKSLTSYMLKNALFHEVDKQLDSNAWDKNKLAVCVLGLFEKIEKYLDEGRMGSYFNHWVNLLDTMSYATRMNIRDRIRNLRNSKAEFLKMVQKTKARCDKIKGNFFSRDEL